jgi:hypothetical protein
MEPYVYRALQTAPNTTRLLQILPGVQGTDIHCLVFDYTLPQDRASGPYEALSYVWGDITETRQIFIRDASPTEPHQETLAHLNVTMNLYAALQRLRDLFIPRLIWIDAVCINQEWMEERAAQVLFMAKIYLHASRVIVWLGEEADDSSRALAGLEQAAMKIRRSDWSNDYHSIFDSESAPTSLQKQAKHSETLVQRSIETLLKRPWFHRVWVSCSIASRLKSPAQSADRKFRSCKKSLLLDNFPSCAASRRSRVCLLLKVSRKWRVEVTSQSTIRSSQYLI